MFIKIALNSCWGFFIGVYLYQLKNKTMIKLDNNYRIEPDGSYLKLVREYEYEKVDSKTRKPTGEVGVKEEAWWDQHIRGLLKIYLRQIGHNETLEEIVEKFDNLEEKINNLPVLTQKDLQWN